MQATQHFTDLSGSLLPRSLDPELPKPEASDPKPYGLTVAEEPQQPTAPVSAESETNPLLEIVEKGVEAGGDPAVRKVPNEERSTVGTIGPAIT